MNPFISSDQDTSNITVNNISADVVGEIDVPLSSLVDAEINDPSEGEILRYSLADKKWMNSTLSFNTTLYSCYLCTHMNSGTYELYFPNGDYDGYILDLKDTGNDGHNCTIHLPNLNKLIDGQTFYVQILGPIYGNVSFYSFDPDDATSNILYLPDNTIWTTPTITLTTYKVTFHANLPINNKRCFIIQDTLDPIMPLSDNASVYIFYTCSWINSDQPSNVYLPTPYKGRNIQIIDGNACMDLYPVVLHTKSATNTIERFNASSSKIYGKFMSRELLYVGDGTTGNWVRIRDCNTYYVVT